jgi:small subunit ribosomal protein S20
MRSAVKTQVKKVRAAVKAGDLTAAETEFRVAAKKLDRAGAKRYIHPNAASRTKSRLQHLLKSAKTAKPVAKATTKK